MTIILSLCGCGGLTPEKYLDLEPKLSLESFFSGKIQAWGVIQDRSGDVIERFDADMQGEWSSEGGVLKELFTYYDGTKKQRTWRIKRTGETTYEGEADDIIGKAQGFIYGNAVRWAYQMDIQHKGRTFRVSFDDWMWLMHDGLVINRSYMKKFGITFAELTVVMKKLP